MRSRFPLRLLAKTFLNAPDLIHPLTRGLIRKHRGVNEDCRRGTGEALKPPYQISLRITNACNHRCAVCGQYGRTGYMNEETGKKLLHTLPAETYRDLVDQVASYRPLFYVTGGEPFLYPGFMDLMGYIKKQGCVLSVVTNGVFLEKNAERIVEDGWDMVMVSFDGPREVHDQCRNFPGAYDTAVAGVRKLNEMKRLHGSVKPFVLTSTTISSVNAKVLPETFAIGSDLMPDLMVVYLSWFTSEAIGHAHEDLLRERLGVDAYTWKSYAASFGPEDAALFREAVSTIESRRWPFPYMIIPNLHGGDLERYYTEPGEFFGYGPCAAPFLMVDVMPNGDVTTCRDFIDVVVGNITERPLLDIWNGEPFKQFRKLLIERGGTLPQCSRCCGLMGF